MGLEEYGPNLVRLTDAHEEMLFTKLPRKTYPAKVGDGVFAHCVFRRNASASNLQDGMPLMYALKGTHGRSMEAREVVRLRQRVEVIAGPTFQPGSYDVVMPAPSSSTLPLHIATQLCRRLGPATRLCDFFQKPTVGQVLSLAPAPAILKISDVEKVQYVAALDKLRSAKQGKLYEAKSVDNRVRHLFPSVKIKDSAKMAHRLRVLLVDDSLQTGSTLRQAAELVRRYFKPVMMAGFALIGPARK